MKKYIKIYPIFYLLLSILLFGCETDVEYVESLKPQSIKIAEIIDNNIPVYTTETFQIKVEIVPGNAEVTSPLTYQYRSGDKDVFTVSDKGLITGIGVGEAVLYITSVEYPTLTTMAMVKITDRYFNITSIELDANFKDYTMALNSTLNIKPYITIKPENASNPAIKYESSDNEIATINEEGLIEAKKTGTVTITIKPVDNSPVSTTCTIHVKETVYTDIDRNEWIITPSHNLPADATIANSPESLIDNMLNTCLSMVKPGKSYGGIAVPATDQVFFVVDMKSEQSFEYLKIGHRSTNLNAYLRPYKLSIMGSNDGISFTSIMDNVSGQPENAEYTIHLPISFKYRYVKILYTGWDTKTGSTIQIAELNIGSKTFK